LALGYAFALWDLRAYLMSQWQAVGTAVGERRSTTSVCTCTGKLHYVHRIGKLNELTADGRTTTV